MVRKTYVHAERAKSVKSGVKARIIVYLILAMLLILVVTLAFLNRTDSELMRALEENREFNIRSDGTHIQTVDLQGLLDLGPQEFSASFATSIAAPRTAKLCGVELRIILTALEIDVTEADYFVVTGMDGYYSPLSREEVENIETIYICYSMDDEILKGRSEGGYGPFMMVVRGSRYAQRWCKYVESVDVITRK